MTESDENKHTKVAKLALKLATKCEAMGASRDEVSSGLMGAAIQYAFDNHEDENELAAWFFEIAQGLEYGIFKDTTSH
ncbi:MAG: hypothetical protein OEZ68_21980 [Gammaproteobacteria bacterium]|nr:hypothetical protein [Gammaproteobacteria bacterium]MDH5803460.1 hypothetical protein [Gammaproteobacteria bacterium]